MGLLIFCLFFIFLEMSRNGKFVGLKDFEDKFEISTECPYKIRNKRTKEEVSEYVENTGYIRLTLNSQKYQKHRLIAKQFIPNPNNFEDVDHINHDRKDNRIENLRWVSRRMNLKNKSSSRGIEYNFFDYSAFSDEEMMLVDEYGFHDFEDYYYNTQTNKFYYDTGVNYRELHISFTRNGSAFVRMFDLENNLVNVFYNKFKREYDLI